MVVIFFKKDFENYINIPHSSINSSRDDKTLKPILYSVPLLSCYLALVQLSSNTELELGHLKLDVVICETYRVSQKASLLNGA